MNLDYILDHNDLSMPTRIKSGGLDGKIEVTAKLNKSPPLRNKNKGAKKSKMKDNKSKDELKKPPRPFTEYTVFFQLEREYIMQTIPGVDTTPQQLEDVYMPLSHHPKMPARYADLVLRSDWYVSGKKKERRRHRKTHGKIGFLELTRTISQRWSSADEEIKAYCKQIALLELDKYKAAMNIYTAKKVCQKEYQQQQGGDETKHLGDSSSSLQSVSQLVNSLCPNKIRSMDEHSFLNFERVEPSSTRSPHLSSAEGDNNGGQHQHDELLDILIKASEIGRGNIERSRSSKTTEDEEVSAAPYSHNSMSSFSLKSSLSRKALYDMKAASPMFGGQDFTRPYDTQYDGTLKGHLLSSAFPSSFHNKNPSNIILDKYSSSGSGKDVVSHDSDVEIFLQRLEDEEDFYREEEEIAPRGSKHNKDESTTNAAIGSVTMVDDTEILNLWDGLA